MIDEIIVPVIITNIVIQSPVAACIVWFNKEVQTPEFTSGPIVQTNDLADK